MAIDLPKQVADYLQSQHLLDEGNVPLPLCNSTQTGNGDVFIKYTTANWPAMLQNISIIAPDIRSQKLIIRVIEFLPPEEYLVALNKLCDLRDSQCISNALFEFIIDERPPKTAFLSYNYQNAQVRQLIARFQSMLPTNNSAQPILVKILDGSKKVTDGELFKYGDAAEPPLLQQ